MVRTKATPENVQAAMAKLLETTLTELEKRGLDVRGKNPAELKKLFKSERQKERRAKSRKPRSG
jgi:hypothetical protein